ncbi:MAG TPA: HAD family hydrolase [Thermoplasmata archaeon]|nr:HAD family hydrolase [Thermoplasmata archaeon]
MKAFPFDLVLIDIDGTLTIESGWRYFAKHLDRWSSYSSTNEAFLAGRETEDEHLRGLLRIVEGVPLARLETLMEETPKLAGISETVRSLRSLGAVPALLSHNPGYVSTWYARRFGFEEWDGTQHRPDPEVVDGIVQGPGSILTDKPGGLRRLMLRHQASPERVVHVGDAVPDAAVFPSIGFGIALNAPLPEVERAADVALRLDDLRGILPVLKAARPRAVARMDL